MKKLSKAAQAKLYTKSGKVNKHLVNAIRSVRFDGNKIYTCRWFSKGRSLKDYTTIICDALKAGGYKYTCDNDAPRGGQEGFHIKCSSTAINFLILLTK
jgi:hypothetical protein